MIDYWHDNVVCLSVRLSVTKCIVALVHDRYRRVPRGHFLFTSSDTFAVGCIVQPQNTVKNRIV